MACYEGHLIVVEYLCKQGGEALLMLTAHVSGLRDAKFAPLHLVLPNRPAEWQVMPLLCFSEGTL